MGERRENDADSLGAFGFCDGGLFSLDIIYNAYRCYYYGRKTQAHKEGGSQSQEQDEEGRASQAQSQLI